MDEAKKEKLRNPFQAAAGSAFIMQYENSIDLSV